MHTYNLNGTVDMVNRETRRTGERNRVTSERQHERQEKTSN